MKSKECSKCKLMKPFTEYHKDNRRATGLQASCKSCKRLIDQTRNKAKRDGTFISKAHSERSYDYPAYALLHRSALMRIMVASNEGHVYPLENLTPYETQRLHDDGLINITNDGYSLTAFGMLVSKPILASQEGYLSKDILSGVYSGQTK